MTQQKTCGPPWLQQKIASGQVVVIDGAMGTELEARGVPMDTQAWSGAAVLTHPDVVRTAHEDYISAGAEVIIANTFATGRQSLARAGLGHEMARVNHAAVKLAQEARDAVAQTPVAIAGSMCPWIDIDTATASSSALDEQLLASDFREQAELLAAAGVDLIALEMCSHPVTSPLIVEAALATGLPVWLGLSCKTDADTGRLVGFDAPFTDFEKLVASLAASGVSVINIMHSLVPDTTAALELLKKYWHGPFGTYPESGHFVAPNWQFVDIISAENLVSEVREWVAHGAQIIGGCCGLTVSHIRALRAAFPQQALP